MTKMKKCKNKRQKVSDGNCLLTNFQKIIFLSLTRIIHQFSKLLILKLGSQKHLNIQSVSSCLLTNYELISF